MRTDQRKRLIFFRYIKTDSLSELNGIEDSWVMVLRSLSVSG